MPSTSLRCTVTAIGATLLAWSPASAATFQPAPPVSTTGTNVGTVVMLDAGGAQSTSCSTVTLTGLTKAAGTPASASFIPAFSGCTTNVISTRPVIVTPEAGCQWRLSLSGAAFNAATGATTGIALSTCMTTRVVPSIPGCRVTFQAQTVSSGITQQNRTAGDAANAPSSGAAAGPARS